ncbi:MAG: alpha/beta hydrolase [Pseudomonadota bacterium]
MAEISMFDPFLFRPEAVDPETDQFNLEMARRMASAPPLHTLKPQQLRDLRDSGKSIWGPFKRLAEAGERTVPGPKGPVVVRVFVPDKIKGVYLHIHGGGFMIGRAYERDESNAEIARQCQLAVVSVDYRLAPENPYPAAPDDCEAAAVWLVQEAEAEFGVNRLIIGGESVGATLSVVTLLRMRDHHGFTGFAGAKLSYGVFDLSCTPSLLGWEDRNPIITCSTMEWFNRSYVSPERFKDPDVSPLYADLSRLPPALFLIGTMDPLLDDSLFMYARWLAAGNPAQLEVYPGGLHAFDLFPLKIAWQANQRVLEFLSECIRTPE